VSENKSNTELIGFRSIGDWSAKDLAIFSTIVSNIYDALRAVAIKRRFEENYIEAYELYVRKMSDFADGPFTYEFYRYWREELRLLRKSGKTFPIPYLFGSSGNFHTDFDKSIPSSGEIYQNLHLYSEESEDLAIHRIVVRSPGGFSFTGIGEIIKELRELIKDLWFRNNQERATGQLEILDKYLEMRNKHQDVSLPIPPALRRDKVLVEVIQDNVKQLKQLEDDKKLESVAENLEYIPE
jgi:hypothetical protein